MTRIKFCGLRTIDDVAADRFKSGGTVDALNVATTVADLPRSNVIDERIFS